VGTSKSSRWGRPPGRPTGINWGFSRPQANPSAKPWFFVAQALLVGVGRLGKTDTENPGGKPNGRPRGPLQIGAQRMVFLQKLRAPTKTLLGPISALGMGPWGPIPRPGRGAPPCLQSCSIRGSTPGKKPFLPPFLTPGGVLRRAPGPGRFGTQIRLGALGPGLPARGLGRDCPFGRPRFPFSCGGPGGGGPQAAVFYRGRASFSIWAPLASQGEKKWPGGVGPFGK